MMPICKKMTLRLFFLSLSVLLIKSGLGYAQVVGVWTETTEEDFASGLGVDTINVDIRTSPGEIVLAESNENFAFGKSADDGGEGNEGYPPKNVLDGNTTTFWLTKTNQPLGVSLTVDLQAERLIEQINILGFQDIFRIRGYRISLSLDKTRWETVAENSNNTQKDVFETISATVARYVRVTIITIDEVHAVAISEIQVYGAGYAAQGFYFSKVKDFGILTNFGVATWVEEFPNPSMDITFQFRTDSIQVLNDGGIIEDTLALANDHLVPGTEVVTDESEMFHYLRGYDYEIDYQSGMIWRLQTSTIDSSAGIMISYSLWGAWSEEYSDPEGSLFLVPEPRRYLQYRINLSTSSTQTPRLKEVSIAYSTTPVAQSAFGMTVPNEVPIMTESKVTYRFEVIFDSMDLGIDTAVVFTPSPARVSQLRWNGYPLSNNLFDDLSNKNKIKIGFFETMIADSSSILEIDFFTTLFFSQNEFPAWIISRQTPDNPQVVEESAATWTVTTMGIPSGPLISVQAKPNPFSPNNDGLFDQTIISYFVAKIAYPQPVSIKIYDLNGDKIKTLRDEKDPAFFYEIPWDGRDDDGQLVPPGLYIYQVQLKTDSGQEVVTKTITVQY